MHLHDTIIIGGGMSGLGCAKRLMERKVDDFLLITKDIGGRAVTSADGQVNYGAYYVRKDYTHLIPYIRLKRKIRLRDLCFVHGRLKASIYDVQNLWHLPSLLWLIIIILRVYRRYLRAKKLSETIEQRETIERDALLYRLYTQPAADFIRENGLQFWANKFIDPLVRSTAFINLRESNAFEIISCIFPLLVPSHEFEPMFEPLIAPFFGKIKYDTVTHTESLGTHWVVTTASGKSHHARCVVIALPIEVAKTLVSIPERTNKTVAVYMAHLRGVPRHQWEHPDFVFFPKGKDDIVVARQENGTYLFYSHDPHYDLSRYFRDWEIIAKRHWNPAFHMGSHLISMDRGNGLYVIGDHNLCGMEDSFTTGIFAANRIGERLANQDNRKMLE